MPSRHRWHPLIFGLFVADTAAFATACRCEAAGTSTDPSASAWSKAEPNPVVDASPSEDQYATLGFAPSDRNWTGEELREAAVRLRTESARLPELLPRFRSARSGKVFDRIVARENSTVFLDPSVPIAIRLPAALVYAQALHSIHELYLTALQAKTVSGEDSVELYGAELHSGRVLLQLVEEFLPTLSRADPKYQTRMEGIAGIHRTVGEVLVAAVRTLSSPRTHGLLSRRRLVELCLETFPVIVPKLALTARDGLFYQLREAHANPDLANLQPHLGTLLERVNRAITTSGGDLDRKD